MFDADQLILLDEIAFSKMIMVFIIIAILVSVLDIYLVLQVKKDSAKLRNICKFIIYFSITWIFWEALKQHRDPFLRAAFLLAFLETLSIAVNWIVKCFSQPDEPEEYVTRDEMIEILLDIEKIIGDSKNEAN